MSFDSLSDLNWLAVVVATLAYFVLGGIWYAPPVLGNVWMKAAGLETPADGGGPGAVIYVAPLVGAFIASVATAMLAAATGSDTVDEGVVLGLVVGIGYAASLFTVTAAFESNKPQASTWAVITGGYHVAGLVLSAVIVSAWQ